MTSRTGPRSEAPRAGAFTLLELIAVLVLISTVLAIAAPSLRGFVHGRQTADTAARLLALTHLARSRAVSRGCIHRLNIDVEAGTYWLTMQQAGAFVEIESDQGRQFRLPVGVSVAVDLPSAEASADESVPFILFYPDGRSDPATIGLVGAQGEVLYVTCPSVSERFRIISPSMEEQRR
jgi:Tfp pilus assembly protein FimT